MKSCRLIAGRFAVFAVGLFSKKLSGRLAKKINSINRLEYSFDGSDSIYHLIASSEQEAKDMKKEAGRAILKRYDYLD